VLVVSGFLVFEHDGKNPAKAQGPGTTSYASYGHAKISAKTVGGPYRRTVVVRVEDRRNGAPLDHAKVIIHGEMASPHEMRLYEKKLNEVGRGTYKGPYTLIMPGNWRVVIIVTSKKGDTSTSALPVRVIG
jgi:YtkA-like protein